MRAEMIRQGEVGFSAGTLTPSGAAKLIGMGGGHARAEAILASAKGNADPSAESLKRSPLLTQARIGEATAEKLAVLSDRR